MTEILQGRLNKTNFISRMKSFIDKKKAEGSVVRATLTPADIQKIKKGMQ